MAPDAVPEALWLMVKLPLPMLATVVLADRLVLDRGAPTNNLARSVCDTPVTMLLPLLRLPVKNCPVTVMLAAAWVPVALWLTVKLVLLSVDTVVLAGMSAWATGAPT